MDSNPGGNSVNLSDNQLKRYNRHIVMTSIGAEGQQKILNAKVLVIGAGGLGSAVLLYLAAAGVGNIGVADADVVDLSNLQRQVIHATPDLNKQKVLSAKEKITRLNPDVSVTTHPIFVDSENILDLIKAYDVVVDGTDNFAAKFLINDACIIAGKPFIHAGVLRFDGQMMTVIPGKTACYRCVFTEPPPPDTVPAGSETGILGAVAGVIGTLQATEVLKYILGQGNLLTNRLMIFDASGMSFREIQIKKRDTCQVCGSRPTIKNLK